MSGGRTAIVAALVGGAIAIVLIAIATVVASVFASYTRADRSSSLGSLAVMFVTATAASR